MKNEHPNVYFLSLTVEEKDTRAKVEEWLGKAGAEGLNIGKASKPMFERLVRAGKGREGVVPTNIFVTGEGNLVQVMSGAHGHETLQQAIARIE